MCLFAKRNVRLLLQINSSKKSLLRHLCTEKLPENVKSFKSIPGPLSLPFIGTLYQYLPLIGFYKHDRLHWNAAKNYKRYGEIVREEILPGKNVLWLFNPNDIQKMFQTEGDYPRRRSHSALEKYRLERPHIYNTGGLLPTNGPEWNRLRKTFQKGLIGLQDSYTFIKGSDSIIQEWVNKRLENVREMPNVDYINELPRLFLEILGLGIFDTRFNCFYGSELYRKSQSSRLIHAASITNTVTMQTENGLPYWKRFNTPAYRKLKKAQEFMESVALNLITSKLSAYGGEKIDQPSTLLEKYLSYNTVDFKDLIGIACDFLLAGVDTTNNATCFLLHHIATNPQAQENLYQETLKLLPNPDDPITVEIYKQAEYARGCLKESFRLRPVAIGVGRELNNDCVMSGYHIPAGTVLVSQNQFISRLEKYFPQADKYKPERWIRSHPEYQKPPHSYIVIPFGHGQRTCIAKRFAELNMILIIMRLVRKYKLIWTGDDLDSRSLLINKPDCPISIFFEKR